jgi:hypothetical protein
MFRYQRILGPCLTAPLPDARITEACVGVAVLRLGMPKRAS